jgi:hypothetical protein
MVQVVALCYECRHQGQCPVYRSLDDLCRALNESLPEPARDFFENELPTLLPVVETCEKFEEGSQIPGTLPPAGRSSLVN